MRIKFSLKKLILYYLYGILLIPVLLHIFLGKIVGGMLHPGLFIHSFILILLLRHLILQLLKGTMLVNVITIMIISFLYVYCVNIFVVELVQFYNTPISDSLRYTFKIFLFLLLAYFIYQNKEFYLDKLNNILTINSLVLVANVIIGYHFQIGAQSYEHLLEDSYRGYLAGNDTSIFSFIVFGYSLFSIISVKTFYKKTFYLILFLLSIYSMYIIATKAFIVAGIILILFLLDKGTNVRKPHKVFVLIGIGATIILLIVSSSTIYERLLMNYLRSISQGEKLIEVTEGIPAYFRWLNTISPGRITRGFMLLGQQYNDSMLNLLFGYGVSGIYKAFGRPPQTEIFSLIGYFGILGFIVFYVPQLWHTFRIIIHRNFDLVNVLFIAIFLYGSFGGFLYGASNTSILFSLLFGLSLVPKKSKMRIRYNI